MALKDDSISDRIDIVFDTYQDTSIKNCERVVRGEELGVKLHDITASQIVRQWRSSHVGNKSSYISFLVSKWRNPDYTKHLNGKDLFVTTEERCYKITTEGRQEVLELLPKYTRGNRWSCCRNWISNSCNQLQGH